jgi:hypothetical protein
MLGPAKKTASPLLPVVYNRLFLRSVTDLPITFDMSTNGISNYDENVSSDIASGSLGRCRCGTTAVVVLSARDGKDASCVSRCCGLCRTDLHVDMLINPRPSKKHRGLYQCGVGTAPGRGVAESNARLGALLTRSRLQATKFHQNLMA